MNFRKLLGKTVTGKKAAEFIMHPKKLRNDLRYHPTQDVSNYYELEDGSVVAARVVTEDDEHVKAYITEFGKFISELPRVNVERIFTSETEVKELNKQIHDSIASDPLLTTGHILTNIVTTGELFPTGLPDWKHAIGKSLQIPIDRLDATLSSLALIDGQMKMLKIKLADFNKTLLVPIFGYTGEVIREFWQGEWLMKPSKQYPNIFEPFIQKADGTLLKYYPEFIDMVVEKYKSFSSHTIADFFTEFDGKRYSHSGQN